MVHHVQDRLDRHAIADRVMKIDDEDRHAFRLPGDFLDRRGTGQQDHQIRVLHPRDPDFLAVDDVTIAFPDCGGLDLGRVGACGGLGHAHGLQAKFARRDLGQVQLLLRLRTVAQQRAHVVHLAVAGTGVSAVAVDFFHDDRRLGQAQPRAAILLGNQRGKPPGVRQRVDEFLRVTPRFIDLAEVLVGELRTEVADGVADILVEVVSVRFHDVL